MKLAVIGTGYVGLVAGAGFSDFGNDVVCVDIDADRVARLRRGEIPIYEPGLEDLVARNARAGRLSFTTKAAEAVAGAEAIFLAVGTPSSEDSDAADLTALLKAAGDIGAALTGWAVIATKSTVPVGTAAKVRAAIAAKTSHAFAVASNPEFLKEGDAVNDFMKPARVILGVDDARAEAVLRNLYAPFVRTNDRIQAIDIPSAELTKYAANALLASRISFMNEIALLAEAVGADIELVRLGVGSDPRIGPKFLFAGPGYGGSCFPKDVRALRHTGNEHGVDLKLVHATYEANARQQRVLGDKIIRHFGNGMRGVRVGIWGLAFKPETDDIREAPALVTIAQVLEAGGKVIAYDPAAVANVKAELGEQIEYADEMYGAAKGVDALVNVTEWHQFRRPDFKRLHGEMRQRVLFDGRNIWNAADVRTLDFTYYGIGRR